MWKVLFSTCCYCFVLAGIFAFGHFPSIAAIELSDAISLDPSETPAVNVQDIRPLRIGEWLEVNASAGTYIYEFKLAAGEATQVEFTALRGVFLTASVWGPDNDKFSLPTRELPSTVSDVYATSSALLLQPVTVVSDRGGKYRVRVDVIGSGSFSIRALAPRVATDRDRKYMEAGRLKFEIWAAPTRRSYDSVLGLLQKEIAIYRELDDDLSAAAAHWRHVEIYSGVGDPTSAIAQSNEARRLFLKLKMDEQAFASFRCREFEMFGDFQGVITCFKEQLDHAQRIGSKEKESFVLNNIGVIYHRLADEAKAQHYYESALTVIRSQTPRTEESWRAERLLFTNFGNLARGMNGGEVPIEFFPERTKEDFEKALPHLFKAVEICERTKDVFIQFNLRQIGNTYAELGQYDEAIRYLERSIKLNVERKDLRVAAIGKKELARVYIRQGRRQEGGELLEEVLKTLMSSTSETEDIALWLHKAGLSDRARELLSKSLEAARSRKILPFQAKILYGLASLERDLGNFDHSRRHVIEAIDIADSLRNRITNDEIRSVYFSAVKKYYDFYIDLLMQAHKAQPEKHYDRIAYEISEKARSRNLVDLLKMSGVDIRQGVDSKLVAEEHSLRRKLAEKAAKETRLLVGRPTEADAAKARKEVSEAVEALARVEAEIKQASPSYAAITQPSNLTVSQVQELLDGGTVLLQYALGEKKSYLWIVSPDSVQSFDLPAKSEIDRRVRAFHSSLTHRNEARRGEAATEASKRLLFAEAELDRISSELSQLLIGPAISSIQNKRIAIVPDGSLNYISFASLSVPQASAGSTLVQSHEIVTLPSASTLAILRRETSVKPATQILAVFADPVFTASDSRAAASKGRKSFPDALAVNKSRPVMRDLDMAVAGAGFANSGLPRLPFSRREADAIFRTTPARGVKKVDFEATKDAVFASSLDNYRIVHFATHGFLDSRQPALSGLVLSLVDKQGNDVDGFLRLQDIYNLKLNADLVVLSACNTALGKEVRGEGIVGLTRGFMYAGAPRVVASLWKVDDAATAHLMSLFYKRMLVDNMRPAAALRAAQVEMMKQPRWRSPYFWAPFVLLGEWK